MSIQNLLSEDPQARPPEVVSSLETDPLYVEGNGAAIKGDSKELLGSLPEESVDLVVTSPPFALTRKKEYGNKDADEFSEWFLEFADRVYDVLKPSGSFVIDIGGSWQKGEPVRSLYHFELLLELAGEDGQFNLAQEFYWHNPAKLPTPAQWVTIERIRVKDAVNHVWWLSKSSRPNADNRRVLKEYSDAQEKLMEVGYKDKERPSGHEISETFDAPEQANGAIRPNYWNELSSGDYIQGVTELLHAADVSQQLIDVAVENDVLDELVDSVIGNHVSDNVLEIANTASNTHYLRACRTLDIDPHPARFPRQLPEFFIKFLTEPGDLVIDIFAGSNTTGQVAEDLGRKWLAFETQAAYLSPSQLRFKDWETIQDLADQSEDIAVPEVEPADN
jgi:site-specific DNA-methyltransferase (cytosine-N4-specific)